MVADCLDGAQPLFVNLNNLDIIPILLVPFFFLNQKPRVSYSSSMVICSLFSYANILCCVAQMYEIVNLADELLPPLPAGTISLPAHSHVFMKGSSVKKPGSSKQGESGSTDIKVSGREKLLRDQPELLQQFGMDILPTMIQVSPLVC